MRMIPLPHYYNFDTFFRGEKKNLFKNVSESTPTPPPPGFAPANILIQSG